MGLLAVRTKKRCAATADMLPSVLRDALAPHVRDLTVGTRYRHVSLASGPNYRTGFHGWVVQLYKDKKLRRVLLCNDKVLAVHVAAAALLDAAVVDDAVAWVSTVVNEEAAVRWLASVDLTRRPPARATNIGRIKRVATPL